MGWESSGMPMSWSKRRRRVGKGGSILGEKRRRRVEGWKGGVNLEGRKRFADLAVVVLDEYRAGSRRTLAANYSDTLHLEYIPLPMARSANSSSTKGASLSSGPGLSIWPCVGARHCGIFDTKT
jgi:hypothetical protein